MGEQDNGPQKGPQGPPRPTFPTPKWARADLPRPKVDAGLPRAEIQGHRPDLMIVDDPVKEPKPTKVKVTRELGICDFCQAAGGQVINAYDPRVYEGRACPTCVLDGTASDYPPDHAAMRPMAFVARALRGDQPFKDLLKAADLQKANPEAAARLKKKMAGRMAPVKVATNRKARREAAARAKKKPKPKKKRGPRK